MTPIIIVDRKGLCIDANPRATELVGYQRQELLSMTVLDLVVAEPGWADEEFRRFIDQGALDGGGWDLRRKDGSLVQVDVSATRVDTGSGGPAIYLAALRDISERKRLIEEGAELVRAEAEAQAQAEAARQRVRFVSDVSELLAVSVDYPATFVRLAELVVREIAGLFLIDLVQASRHPRAGRGGAREPVEATLGGIAPWLRASNGELAPGRPGLGDRRGAGVLRVGANIAGHHPRRGTPGIVGELGIQSYLSVPLIARGRTLGVLSLVSTTPDIRYGESDVRLAEEIAASGRPDRQRAALRGTGPHRQSVAEEPAASTPSLHPACRSRSALSAGRRGERGRRGLLRRLRLR